MPPGGTRRLTVVLAIVCWAYAGLQGQTVTYTLLQPPTGGTARVTFAFQLPAGATFQSWEIQGALTPDLRPTRTLPITPSSVHLVRLNYLSSANANQVLEASIDILAALFHVTQDPALSEGQASFIRVLRSAYRIDNDPAQLQGRTFRWAIPGFDEGIHSFPNGLGHFPNIYHTFPSGGTHSVTLEVTSTNAPGFVARHTQDVEILPELPAAERVDLPELPNVFTPNSDGTNDYFEVNSCGTVPLDFKVFSRWGSMVFHQRARVIRWDGRNYHGQELPEGIYYYIVDDATEPQAQARYNTAKGFFYIFRDR